MANALNSMQIMHIEAVAQNLLSAYVKFAASIQSPANRKIFLDIVDDARINANDTVYTERASDDWEAIFKGTIESQLCCVTLPGSEKQRERTLAQLRAYFERVTA